MNREKVTFHGPIRFSLNQIEFKLEPDELRFDNKNVPYTRTHCDIRLLRKNIV